MYSQEHSEDHESVSDDTCNSWCKHRVIAEQIEMLSDKDLCASGQTEQPKSDINKIHPCQEGHTPFIPVSLGEGQCFRKASEVPRV